MRNWRTKLTSRKFWCAVVGVVISVMVIFGSSDEEQAKVTGLITACGTLVAYIVGEGMTDAAHKDDEAKPMFSSTTNPGIISHDKLGDVMLCNSSLNVKDE
jgi:hypothetical protein